MIKTNSQGAVLIFVCIFHLLTSCDHKSKLKTKTPEKHTAKFNPVTNMDRAIKFYGSVFNFNFDKEIIDNHEMALFPFVEENAGISGALAIGEIYKPTKDGVVIYFKTENIDETIKLASANGGQILYPKTDNGIGFVAEVEDSEGNRIALYQSKK